MLKTRLLVFIILAPILSGQFVRAQSSQLPEPRADVPNNKFVVGPRFVHMPKGVFVLVRRGREIGAIRFTRIEPSGAIGQGSATYESYFQGDGSGSFLTTNVVKRSGEITIKPLKGISHSTMWQPGQDKLWVGKWWFGCLGITLVNMSPHFGEKANGFEFAPTSARDVSEIDISDKRLQWFRYDSNASITLSVSELPK